MTKITDLDLDTRVIFPYEVTTEAPFLGGPDGEIPAGAVGTVIHLIHNPPQVSIRFDKPVPGLERYFDARPCEASDFDNSATFTDYEEDGGTFNIPCDILEAN